AVIRGVEGAGRDRDIGRAGVAHDVGVVGRVHGNPHSEIHLAPSDERGVYQARAGWVQLGDVGVVGAVSGSAEGPGSGRKIARTGLAGDISAARRIHRDAQGVVNILAASQIGGVYQGGTGRV